MNIEVNAPITMNARMQVLKDETFYVYGRECTLYAKTRDGEHQRVVVTNQGRVIWTELVPNLAVAYQVAMRELKREGVTGYKGESHGYHPIL